MRVGFIGLGRMGGGMARRLLGAGHELCVFDVVAAQTAPFEAAGARVAKSIAELAAGSEIVVTMLVEDRDRRSGRARSRRPLERAAAGAIHLVMGTHGVATVRELESKHRAAGQTLVAAPVLGRPDLAASGQLGIVVAGPDGRSRAAPSCSKSLAGESSSRARDLSPRPRSSSRTTPSSAARWSRWPKASRSSASTACSRKSFRMS